MICPICKTRFADFPEEDYILDLPVPPGRGIIARSKEAHERRMKIFESDEKRFCSDECSNAFLEMYNISHLRNEYLQGRGERIK